MELNEKKLNEMKWAITSALAQLYKQDKCLIKNNTHERAIVFRFGLYFSKIIECTSFGTDTDLYVDVEYNRDKDKAKSLQVFNAPQRVIPDLILHHRGSNDKNIVVIEFKHKSKEFKHDYKKIKELTNQNKNTFHYGLGVFIKLGEECNKCDIVYFRDGKILNLENDK